VEQLEAVLEETVLEETVLEEAVLELAKGTQPRSCLLQRMSLLLVHRVISLRLRNLVAIGA
jgi:hypothetical protein